MIFSEEKRDLFSVPNDYILCHCISSDFALGAGIAKEFRMRGVRDELLKNYFINDWHDKGIALKTEMNNQQVVFNLVTKRKYFNKPTYETVRESLNDMKFQIFWGTDKNTKFKIAMPLIACGLDSLKWEKVSNIIQEVFNDTNVEILVCRL